MIRVYMAATLTVKSKPLKCRKRNILRWTKLRLRLAHQITRRGLSWRVVSTTFPSDPVLLARWTELSDQMIQEAKSAGIDVTKEDLATLSSVKIEVISGQQVGDWREDAKLNLPAFKAAQELRDLKDTRTFCQRTCAPCKSC